MWKNLGLSNRGLKFQKFLYAPRNLTGLGIHFRVFGGTPPGARLIKQKISKTLF